jgi:hypothetical protein
MNGTNDRLRQALRRKIEKHNRFLSISSALAAAGVVFMWVVIYFLAQWITVFARTLKAGVDATPPRNFPSAFLVVAAVWMAAGVVDWLVARRDPPRIERGIFRTILDVLLFPPRATFGVFRGFGKKAALSEDELQTAADFLARRARFGEIALSRIDAELPDEALRGKILDNLKALELVYRREGKHDDFITPTDPQKVLQFLER